jgi:glucose-6-phosphate isomerase/transaldolase/glucose-6-phosphate isomerase
MSSPLPEPLASRFAETLARLDRDRVVERLWHHDHTLWAPEPREIADRLGWLRYAPSAEESARLTQLAAAARQEGIEHVVLLGMGGSSLGAEALGSSIPPPGDANRGETHPELLVLDSTVPERVRQVRAAIEPARTLFLVASKSGTTAEVQALFDYFWRETTLASDDPGRCFLVITDADTPLVNLAASRGFREIFTNPSDIGGRFSVLSLFGIVPAALAGLDVGELLARASAARAACQPDRPAADNPGAALGALLGAAALAGRDQATLLVPRRLAAFGLWVEQLLAESTGKAGRGILPVAGEPFAAPAAYGDRRIFVHLRLASDPDAEVERQAARLAHAGHPVWQLELGDPYDLGAQMFLWQVATAVAAHLLGVHPFDQPDVQSAKTRTHEALAAWERTGALPPVSVASDLAAALDTEPPSYVALLAYLGPTAELEAAVGALRSALVRRGLTTTFGYGPRYLHSTGQLHKGGPAGGLHVEIVPRAMADLPIPGRRYGFATLAAAQAAGDLLALQAAGRRCARLVVSEPAAELARLASELEVGAPR